jgi:hypothetical protein
MELSVCVATGKPFHGRAVEQGLVVYLIGEGKGGLDARLQALAHARGGLGDLSLLHFVKDSVSLSDEAGIAHIAERIQVIEQKTGHKLAMLVVDTFFRYSTGDENDATSLREFMRGLAKLAPKSTRVVVHHTGHGDATRGRGTSAWGQVVDTEFIASSKKDKETGVVTITIANTKQKDGETAGPQHYKLVTGIPTKLTRVGAPLTSVALEPTTAPKGEIGEKSWADMTWDARLTAVLPEVGTRVKLEDAQTEVRKRYPQDAAPASLDDQVSRSMRNFTKLGRLKLVSKPKEPIEYEVTNPVPGQPDRAQVERELLETPKEEDIA